MSVVYQHRAIARRYVVRSSDEQQPAALILSLDVGIVNTTRTPFRSGVVDDRDGVQHRGTLQLPRSAPAAPGRPPSAALARLRPLMSAHGDALAAQEEGLDPERLSRTSGS